MPFPTQQGRGQPIPDYDIEGYIKKYGVPDQSKGQHLTDEFKLPNHITFSTDSKYSTPEKPGGVWSKRSDNKWSYTPSDFVLQTHSAEKLQEYFKKYEPDSELILPKKGQFSGYELKQSGLKALLRAREGM